ncbi:glycosyltransferase family 1 protein [Amylocarpus encephaloides]|uniref:UDP-N-acetylglucosamine transferase subunit ALG14 n=1 Tax=Amylocarpus encephaloides TaxID=45428 RepID=A0A9P7YRH2_9HELO|nr:glycosyltransferase family 1 protein [Amylocarpus encephaloides]
MAPVSVLPLLTAAILIILTTAFLRWLHVLPSASRKHWNPNIKYPKTTPSQIVVVLGSGGHTAEMMSLLRDVDPTRYKRRTYIVSSGDSFSTAKASEIEKRIQDRSNRNARRLARATEAGQYDATTGIWAVKTVPRARKIHQPLYSTPFSALWCLFGCFKVLYETRRDTRSAPGQFPDLIMANGPATAVIVIFAATILRYLSLAPLWTMKVIYIESWARVKTLSLSGKILLKLGVCTKFMVQWEALAKEINGSSGKELVEWRGFLVE